MNTQTHKETAAKHLFGPCDVRVTDWPYECAAKDKHPTHVVYTCLTHNAWWHTSQSVLMGEK